ncbi:MAG: hypothetical protein J5529_13925 [Prevotella sp.]|nr:hypothetical protein [Prevotella sp.]
MMEVLERLSTNDGMLSVVKMGNMLALRNGDVGYSCIYTDASVYQPIYMPIQRLLLSFTQSNHIEDALVLGGGCCTIPRYIIKKFNNTVVIDTVEYCEEIIFLTQKYFLINLPTNNLNIIKDDAFSFIEKTNKKYDFIYVDLFVGSVIPKQAHTHSFLKCLSEHTKRNCLVAFNIYKSSIDECRNLTLLGSTYFKLFAIMTDEEDENSRYVIFLNGNLNALSHLNIIESK